MVCLIPPEPSSLGVVAVSGYSYLFKYIIIGDTGSRFHLLA
jgi:hypothetical protein